MARTLTLGSIRMLFGAESPHEEWEEVGEEVAFPLISSGIRFQDATTGAVTYTIANLPGITNLRFLYVKNHDSAIKLNLVVNKVGSVAILDMDIDANGVFLLKGLPKTADGEVLSVVLTPASGTVKYTLLMADE